VSVAIYIYHDIGSRGHRPCSPERFSEDLENIRRAGLDILSFQTLLTHGVPDHEAVILTLDDGLSSHFEVAAPILDAFRMPAVFCVSTAPPPTASGPYMTPEQVRQLGERYEIAGHGHRHTPAATAKLSKEDVLADMTAMRETFARWGVHPIDVFVPPQGQNTQAVSEAAQLMGFKAIRTTQHGRVDAGTDFMNLPGIEGIPR